MKVDLFSSYKAFKPGYMLQYAQVFNDRKVNLHLLCMNQCTDMCAAGWIFHMQMQCLRRIKDDVLVTWEEKLRWNIPGCCILVYFCYIHVFTLGLGCWTGSTICSISWMLMWLVSTQPPPPYFIYYVVHVCFLWLLTWYSFFNPSKACAFFSLDSTLVNCLIFFLKSAWH